MKDLDNLAVYVFYVWIFFSIIWFLRTMLQNWRVRSLESDGAPESVGQDSALSTIAPALGSIAVETTSSSPSSQSDSLGVIATAQATAVDLRDTGSVAEPALSSALLGRTVTTEVKAPRKDKKPTGSGSELQTAPATVDRSAASATGRPPADSVSTDSNSIANPPTSEINAESSAPRQDAPNPPSTISELLAGVRLPLNLLPILPNGESPSDQKVTLISSSAPPETLGAALADELERLGFSIHTLATDEAVARRDGQRLSLRIHPDASTLTNAAGARFPDAEPNSVGVDLWVSTAN